MILKNYTPHEINLYLGNGDNINLPSAGIARCTEEIDNLDVIPVQINNIQIPVPLIQKRFGHIIDLPPPESGIIYIVSVVVAQAAAAHGRMDVVFPGELVRNTAGQIIGTKSLATYPR